MLAIGSVSKAFWTIPEAVRRHREARGASMIKSEAEKEDVLLDLLVFLAERRERSGLFSVVD